MSKNSKPVVKQTTLWVVIDQTTGALGGAYDTRKAAREDKRFNEASGNKVRIAKFNLTTFVR